MSEDQRNSPKLLIGIIGGLCAAAAVLFFAFQWLAAPANEDLPAYEEISTNQTAASSAAVPAQASSAQAEADEVSAASAAAPLITEDILNTPIPQNASLAKEEEARLADLQLQLAEQEKILQAQHADADQLIKLKEQQLKLLEQQLAEAP